MREAIEDLDEGDADLRASDTTGRGEGGEHPQEQYADDLLKFKVLEQSLVHAFIGGSGLFGRLALVVASAFFGFAVFDFLRVRACFLEEGLVCVEVVLEGVGVDRKDKDSEKEQHANIH